MRPRRPRPLLLLLLVAALASSALAATTAADNTDATTTAAAATTEATKAATTETTAAAAKTTDAATTQTTDKTDDDTATTKTTAGGKVTITATNSDNAQSTGDLPSLSSGSSSSDSEDLPTLTPTGDGYTIPVVTPPSNAGAPFMQHSNLPDGTVFIAVGSGLAFFALCTLAWRGLVAWSLHRSVKRAARDAHLADTKAMLGPTHHRGGGGGGGVLTKREGPDVFYGNGAGSTLSLDHLATGKPVPGPRGGGGGGAAGGGLPQSTSSSSLFFSPTAGAAAAAGGGGGAHAGGDRRSAYLPAGFYAAGNRSSTAPSNSSQLGLPPSTNRYSRVAPGISPPGSPLMGRAGSGNESTSSLSLPPTGRAPSAYLDDLFESHNMPPPGHRNSTRY